jgi:hypothetical protein
LWVKGVARYLSPCTPTKGKKQLKRSKKRARLTNLLKELPPEPSATAARWETACTPDDYIWVRLVRAFLPLLSIRMERPHDGIAEEVSNQLNRAGQNEKRKSVRRPVQVPATYAHITADPAEKLMHVQITGSDFVISIIDEIIDEPCLDTWIAPAWERYAPVMLVRDR